MAHSFALNHSTPRNLGVLGRLVVAAALVGVVGCSSGAGEPAPPQVVGDAIGVEGAHEHGVLSLGAAVDGLQVTLDIEMPAQTLFGFEHAPSTDEEIAVVRSEVERMRAEVAGAIAFPEALGCHVDAVEVLEAPDVDSAEGDEAHAEHEHNDQVHDEDHDHDEHHAQEEQHSQAEDEDHAHSEVRMRVVMQCTESPEGHPATLRITDLLPGAEQVDLTVITSMGQAAGRVASDAEFSF